MKLLKEGDVIDLSGRTVYCDKRHKDITIKKSFYYWVVYKTTYDGGGTGHGFGDVYPNGHHVFCEQLHTKRKVDFYQNGCFRNMIGDIKPIGKAERTWVLI